MKKIIEFFKMDHEERLVTLHFFLGFAPPAVLVADLMISHHDSPLAIFCGVTTIGGFCGLVSIFIPPIFSYLRDYLFRK